MAALPWMGRLAQVVGALVLAYGFGLLLAFIYGWWEARTWRD